MSQIIFPYFRPLFRKSTFFYIYIVSFLLGFFGTIPLAKACNCDTTETWAQKFEVANVVVLGTCIEVTTNPIKSGLNVIFQIDSSWKRRIERVATFHTNSPGQCGYDFRKGQRYLVFGNKHHQSVRTSICEPTLRIEKGQEFSMPELGEGFGPGRPEVARKMNLMLVLLTVLGLIFLGFVVLRKRFSPQNHTTDV